MLWRCGIQSCTRRTRCELAGRSVVGWPQDNNEREDMEIMMGNEEVTIEVEGTGKVWFRTPLGVGNGRHSKLVSVEDAMALVNHLVEQMPVFEDNTYRCVRNDVLAYEARKRGDELNRKIAELGVQYFDRGAGDLTLKERELIERLLVAEGGQA